VESVKRNFVTLYDDPLSFGGKFMPHLPGFYYLLAGADMLQPYGLIIFASIVPALIAFVAYFFAGEITSNPGLRLLAAFLATYNPDFLQLTTNTLSPLMLTLLLFFFTAGLFLRLERNKQLLPYLLISSLLLALTSLYSIVLVAGLWLYFGLIKLQGLKLQARSLEFTIFYSIFTFIVGYLSFVKASMSLGIAGLLVQAKRGLFTLNMVHISWVSFFSGLGILAVLFGIYGLYLAVQQDTKKRQANFLIALGLILLGLIVAGFAGMPIAFFGFVLAMASVYSVAAVLMYIQRLKSVRALLTSALIILIVIPLFASAINGLGRTELARADMVEALSFIRENSPQDSVVMAPLKYGHMISYFANRSNVADSNFLNSGDLEVRLNAIHSAYTTVYETEALSIFEKYGVKYILVNPEILSEFQIPSLRYVGDAKCFKKVYDSGTAIYEVLCRLK